MEDLRIDPDRRKIGDGVKPRLRLHIQIGQGVALGDVAGNRRVERKLGDHPARLPQPLNLGRRNLPLREPSNRGGKQRLGSLGDSRHRAALERLRGFFRQQIFLLRCYQIGAVDGEKGLAFLDELIRCIGVHLPYPSRKARLHVGDLALIHLHVARCPNLGIHSFGFHHTQLDSDALHALGRELNGGKSSFRGDIRGAIGNRLNRIRVAMFGLIYDGAIGGCFLLVAIPPQEAQHEQKHHVERQRRSISIPITAGWCWAVHCSEVPVSDSIFARAISWSANSF